jgi:hypothetical protein
MRQDDLPKMVTIIPGGCIQFIDRTLNLNACPRVRLYFREQRRLNVAADDGSVPFDLFCLEMDDDNGECVDRITRKPGRSDYEIDGAKALEIFLDRWVPVPMLHLKPERWPDGARKFEAGPSNWARIFITRAADGDSSFTHKVVLAIDSVVEDRQLGSEETFALSPDDVAGNSQFALASHERDNAWFLNSEWVDDWLKECHDDFLARKRKGKKNWADEEESQFLHLANYLTFLELIARADILPMLRVTDPERQAPIDVDLVLDIGNSRTCGILVETRPQSTTNLNDSYVLQIRDLSHPERIHTDPFETRVEFAEASFGNSRLSARSGRETEAFNWPSVVRIGPEATRLGAESWGGEGATGMSSPKRYLWDERARQQQWRFNGTSPDGMREPPVTRGLFVQCLNKEGSPIDRLDEPMAKRNPVLKRQSRDVAFESCFTRSSLMMFLLSELIIHALITINSPAQRNSRDHSDIPRRLRRIIVTVPTAMPLAEQKIFRRWVNWAVGMVWSTLGWKDWYVARGTSSRRMDRPDYRLSPEIRCEWDEATCSQLIFIYNELVEKYQGDVHYLFRLLGKKRDGRGTESSLRIASIDIGGGTSDLSIATYEVMGDESSTGRIRPHIDFRDGFNIAGDDILCSVIEDHFLPALGDALGRAGAIDPRGMLSRLFGRDVLGQTQADRNRRGQFARQIAASIGLGLLRLYEETDPHRPTAPLVRRIGDIVAAGQPGNDATAYLDEAARRAGAQDFRLLGMELKIDFQGIDRTISSEVGRILSNLCEIVHLYDCDLLLLTGRPSRWPAVTNAVLAKLPVAPDRILPLSQMHVGRWYPFADHFGRIRDPKTTVVVGAILSALSEGHLEGFGVDTINMQLKSTARFIGEMDLESKLKRPKVWFEVDCNSTQDKEHDHTVMFSGPLAIGFRQLDAERWPTTRFYMLDFAYPEARSNAQNKLPYAVKLSYRVTGMEDAEPGAERDEGELKIEEVVTNADYPVRAGELEVRLQTLPSSEGYWLDTGIFNVV